MNIDKSIQRISWRFSQGNSFKPNENDITALNDIITWVNNQREGLINDNQLFAKLYIYVYHKFIQHYETTVFDNTPQSELHKILDKPISAFYKAFTKQLNDNEIYEAISKCDLKENNLKNVWDIETVTENLNSQLTKALNTY